MKILVPQSIAQERYDICKSCPRFTAFKLCSICNCIMPVKVKFAAVGCPAGKWNPLSDESKLQSEPYEDLK